MHLLAKLVSPGKTAGLLPAVGSRQSRLSRIYSHESLALERYTLITAAGLARSRTRWNWEGVNGQQGCTACRDCGGMAPYDRYPIHGLYRGNRGLLALEPLLGARPRCVKSYFTWLNDPDLCVSLVQMSRPSVVVDEPLQSQCVPTLCHDSDGQHPPSSSSLCRVRLPLEVIYLVLDLLAVDPRFSRKQLALSHCTLTCRAWLHHASRLLLSTIDVDRWDPSTCQWVTLSTLLDFAKSSLRLQLYVTSISENLESLCAVSLEDINRVLPNVRSLVVRGQPRPEQPTALLPSAVHISTLELNGMRADAFAACLSRFTSIDHLRLVQPHRYTFGLSRPLLLTQNLRVAKVSFEDMGLGARDPFLMLQGIIDPSSIRSVSVTHRDDACAWYHGDAILEGLDTFLSEVGHEIRNLSLDASHFRRGGCASVLSLRYTG